MSQLKNDSVTSVTSLGLGSSGPSLSLESLTQVTSQFNLSDQRSSLYGHSLNDIASFIITCSHKKIPVCKVDDSKGGIWLPYVELASGEKWQNSWVKITELLIRDETVKPKKMSTPPYVAVTNLQNVTLLDISRLQLPHGDYMTRLIYFGQWNGKCCKSTPSISWLSVDEIEKSKNLWGSEVLTYARKVETYSNDLESVKLNLWEYTSADVLKYSPSQKTENLNPVISLYVDLLREANYGDKEIVKIYFDFIQHCHPSLDMSLYSFMEYMKTVSFTDMENNIHLIFNAFNHIEKGFLTFHEFLLGIVAMDQSAPHTEARCPFIFRYYDQDGDEKLNYNEFSAMIKDIRKNQKQSLDENEVTDDIKKRLEMPHLVENEMVSYERFTYAVGTLKLRGTSTLFRTNISLLRKIIIRNAYDSIFNYSVDVPFGYKKIGTCPKCRPKQYQLAFHSVILEYNNGRIIDPMNILHTDGSDIEFKVEDDATELMRKHSMETVFSDKSAPNCIISSIRMYSEAIANKSKVMSLSETSLSLTTLTTLCKEAEDVFSSEDRVLMVNTPCYVLSDINGNLKNLMTLERQIWRTAPGGFGSSLLFLGNYIDGNDGIECVAYLFALKILMPDKVFLLRGNHEIRSVQMNLKFANECIKKYDETIGKQVFELINDAFDRMPICAVVDETIFCSHGGIPKSITNFNDLQKIMTPLKDAEKEAPAAWEIFWSDPIESNQISPSENLNDNGFLKNTNRGTGFFYTETAVDNFLTVNEYTHIIRGHETSERGYHINFNGKVITIFTSSGYGNPNNRSACVFIDRMDNEKGWIRVLSLET